MHPAQYRRLAAMHTRIATLYEKEADSLEKTKVVKKKAVKKAVKKKAVKRRRASAK